MHDDIADHLVAVLRELLSNIARNAHASCAQIKIEADDDYVLLRVTDNSACIEPAPQGGNDLSNVTQWARDIGAAFTITALPDGGNAIEWRLPRPIA